jgi:CheY-like chemotaxis protein
MRTAPHVLLADDALGFRFALKAALESHGAGSVTVCEQWADIARVAGDEQPDAILVDLLMPTFDADALRATRAAAPEAVLAVVSSYSREDALRQLEGVDGIDLIFNKGERPDAIASRLLAAVSRSEA